MLDRNMIADLIIAVHRHSNFITSAKEVMFLLVFVWLFARLLPMLHKKASKTFQWNSEGRSDLTRINWLDFGSDHIHCLNPEMIYINCKCRDCPSAISYPSNLLFPCQPVGGMASCLQGWFHWQFCSPSLHIQAVRNMTIMMSRPLHQRVRFLWTRLTCSHDGHYDNILSNKRVLGAECRLHGA